MKAATATLACVQTSKFLMQGNSATAADVARLTGVHESTAARLLKLLHAHKLVFICGWVDDAIGRAQTPQFAWGSSPDVARHKQTGAQRTQAYRERLRAKKLANTPKGTPT